MRRVLLLGLALSAAALPAQARADASDVTLALATGSVIYGDTVTAVGVVTPGMAGTSVTIRVDGVAVATTSTADDGSYSASFAATISGLVDATTAGATSTASQLGVGPRVTLRVGLARSWLPTRVVATVEPATFSGTLRLSLGRGGTTGGARVVHLHAGTGRLTITAKGSGRFVVTATTTAADGLDATTLTLGFKAVPRTLRVGSSGADVRALLRRLERLGFHTPGIASTLTAQASDSVMAFQKAYRLARTYVFGRRDWWRLLHPRTLTARYRGPGTHIEIDKTRQILLIVREGRVRFIVAVSTGKTGNTPEGAWHVLWRAPKTRTWLGPLPLWWTMTFHGNFAIHGFAPVPPYPASHGCTREPIWISPWVYQRSYVGEPVYVYH